VSEARNASSAATSSCLLRSKRLTATSRVSYRRLDEARRQLSASPKASSSSPGGVAKPPICLAANPAQPGRQQFGVLEAATVASTTGPYALLKPCEEAVLGSATQDDYLCPSVVTASWAAVVKRSRVRSGSVWKSWTRARHLERGSRSLNRIGSRYPASPDPFAPADDDREAVAQRRRDVQCRLARSGDHDPCGHLASRPQPVS